MFCERSGFTALRQAAYLPFIGQRRSLVMFAGVFLQVMIEMMKTSQELRVLSRSLSDCKSLLLNVMIQVSQFIRNGQLCH